MIGLGLCLIALWPDNVLSDGPVQPAHLARQNHGFVAGYAASAPSAMNPLNNGSGAAPPPGSYHLSGEKSLRPSQIGDDGVHMYLIWTEEQVLPAVFALNAVGDEEMVDGYMRQGIFTIDRVHDTLVFRIGKKRARAERVSR